MQKTYLRNNRRVIYVASKYPICSPWNISSGADANITQTLLTGNIPPYWKYFNNVNELRIWNHLQISWYWRILCSSILEKPIFTQLRNLPVIYVTRNYITKITTARIVINCVTNMHTHIFLGDEYVLILVAFNVS